MWIPKLHFKRIYSTWHRVYSWVSCLCWTWYQNHQKFWQKQAKKILTWDKDGKTNLHRSYNTISTLYFCFFVSAFLEWLELECKYSLSWFSLISVIYAKKWVKCYKVIYVISEKFRHLVSTFLKYGPYRFICHTWNCETIPGEIHKLGCRYVLHLKWQANCSLKSKSKRRTWTDWLFIFW